MPVVSIIIPTWQEASTIQETLQRLQGLRRSGHQVIVVDGGSDDGTPVLAKSLSDAVLTGARGRAAQMNLGASVANGDLLLFLHADTVLPAHVYGWLLRFWRSDRCWGRFDVKLSGQQFMLRVVEFMITWRSRITGIATGDQAIFVKAEAFQMAGGFPWQPLMEDVELSRKLKFFSRPFCVPAHVLTDSRRWEDRGVWHTILLMWSIRWRYWRGVPADRLFQEYRSDVRKR